MKTKVLFILLCLLVTGCIQINTQPTEAITSPTPTVQPTMSGLPNPASAYCEKQGYKLEIRTGADGSQLGFCIFPDGSMCEEWAYYRKECAPTNQPTYMPNPASVYCEQQGYTLDIRTADDGGQVGMCIFPDSSECEEWAYFRGDCQPAGDQGWQTFTNDTLGYTFLYPAEAQVTTIDNPLKGLSIEGSGMGFETWGLAHPTDRQDYRPPENADLLQWLSDHYLLGENQMPDVQIAGTTAVHFRHERSPQSYAFDQYYFAHLGQLYQITIGHSSDIEDWALDNRFLQSFQFIEPAPTQTAPIPTALPIDPAAYHGWSTYTHPTYGFSFRLPDGWVVEEVTSGDPLLVGHELNIYNAVDAQPNNIRLTFRQIGEDTLLWPTGVGQGDFITQGTLDIAGQPALRVLLVCPAGEVTAIWYHQADGQPNITRGNLEFGFIFSTPGHCESGYSLSGSSQLIGEMIIASLQIP